MKKDKKEIESICPANQKEWREWLELNHSKKESVWLIIHKKDTLSANISWSQAVDIALCFGWIDSIKRTIDSEKYKQFFGRRKVVSTWSKINKQKIKTLIESGQMTDTGFRSIEEAKANGSWSILDEVEALIIPDDLQREFSKYPDSMDYFLALSNVTKKRLLQWVVLAKRTETRHYRIAEIAENAGQKIKPKQFR
ncbi:MAG: hypothetical protein HKN76_20710 [Saprospiraceae bacterium]|nr:hypothetical protein [Saprospiraceae bacterium]